jgi:FtsH-binding integral membrane protein
MADQFSTGAAPWARSRSISTGALLGQVSFLVAIALGFAALGGFIGRDLAFGTARILSFAGIGMLLIGNFAGARFRVGTFAMGWFFATATVIGLGIGPFLNAYLAVDPGAVSAAAGGTALTVGAMGAFGFATSKDLIGWMKPLSYLMFGLFALSIVSLVLTGPMSPFLSLAIYGVSALLILVDFNYLRKHGTEDDAVLLATGIFVSIINIFLSLLNLFSR